MEKKGGIMRTKTAITIILTGVTIIFFCFIALYHAVAVVPLTRDAKSFCYESVNREGFTAETLESMERLKNDLDALHISIAAFEDILMFKVGSTQSTVRHLD
jgi:Kef-type K+ transport system membrane component KefB